LEFRAFFQKSQGREGGMSLVHVKHFDIGIAERAQHGDARKSQNGFLA